MLEWLKTILGDAYTDDIDNRVSAEIGKAFVSKSDFNALNSTKKTLEGQLITAKEDAKKDYENDLKAVKLNYALEARLTQEGAVNTKAVKALLDSSKISLDGENIVGIDEQLKALKDSEKWAFKQEKPTVPGAGGNPPPTPPTNNPLPSGTVIF